MQWTEIINFLSSKNSDEMIFIGSSADELYICKCVSALANGPGGTMIIGVDPNNAFLTGAHLETKALKEIITANCSPLPALKVEELSHQKKRIIMVRVAAGHDKPYMVDEVCYMRSQGLTRPIRPEEEDNLKGYPADKELNARQKKALGYIKARENITNREYRDLFDVSHKTAHLELTAMVDKDLLEVTGSGRSTAYVMATANESSTVADPAPPQKQSSPATFFNLAMIQLEEERLFNNGR